MQFFGFVVMSVILPSLRAEALAARANPIRRVVNMLQAMQKKVVAEGEKEEDLFHKFMCYCKTNKGDLEDGMAAAETKVTALASEIEESGGAKAQLDADLKKHKADRADAKKSVAEANSLREKEAAAYASSTAELKTNSAAITKADGPTVAPRNDSPKGSQNIYFGGKIPQSKS